MKVGVVGCGRIGARRAEIARELGDEVATVADVDPVRAREIAARVGAEWTTEWPDVVSRVDIDAVVVSAINSILAPVTIAALRAGKHVLCEKPLGRNPREAREIVTAAREATRTLKVGFNHRHHPGLAKAHELLKSGTIGPAFAIRAGYGHGGRAGYEREWRADPEKAGGGELLDQGVHVVDLCRWFLGEFVEVSGMTSTWFWPVAPLEDNAFALLRTADGKIASLHTSWTQWKNLFRLEVLGREGHLIVEGLGGSYGVETLTLGRRSEAFSAPNEQRWSFPGPDRSWQHEWEEFRAAIREGREPAGSGRDGYAAALIIEAIYESANRGHPVAVGARA